jgi:hypothetical protein
MCEIRNSDGRLVCRIDERAGEVEIKAKGCVTLLKLQPDGTISVVNIKETA